MQRYLRSRLNDETDVHDISQEACIKMLRVKHIDKIKHPKAYFYRIARNLLYEYYSGRHSRVDTGVDFDALEADTPTMDQLLVHTHRKAQINTALQALPPKCQRALVLRWRDGHSVADIADLMGLSRAMIKKYLATGLAHFRKRLRSFVDTDQRID